MEKESPDPVLCWDSKSAKLPESGFRPLSGSFAFLEALHPLHGPGRTTRRVSRSFDCHPLSYLCCLVRTKTAEPVVPQGIAAFVLL